MSPDTISWLLPAQPTASETLEALARIRDQAVNHRAEIILIDRPSTIGLSGKLPSDVLLVRTECPLPLTHLLQTGLKAAKGEIIIWSPDAAAIPETDVSGLVDLVTRQDALILSTKARSRFPRDGFLRWLQLQLSRESFVARRPTAEKVARRLSFLGDYPVSTAIVLLAMRLRVVSGRTCLMSTPSHSRAGDDTAQVRRPSPNVGATAPHSSVRGPVVSVIITAHNEGPEVLRTVESVKTGTSAPIEFIVVDDGSTDGSCDNLPHERLRRIRHETRIGVAFSRNAGASIARGDVLLFLDGHQRVSAGCLERCSSVALAEQAIVWPDVRALHNRGNVGHGAFFRLGKNSSPFTATWNGCRARQSITKISSLRAPGYFVPRNLFDALRWISQLRGWGGSEAAIALKAFFLGIDILHVCGPLARHHFRPKFQYSVTDLEVTRNHALIARVCFDDRTWFEYWLPRVFEGCLSPETIDELDAPEVMTEHEEFLKLKRRPDHEFWRGLLRRKEPATLSHPRPPLTTALPEGGTLRGS